MGEVLPQQEVLLERRIRRLEEVVTKGRHDAAGAALDRLWRTRQEWPTVIRLRPHFVVRGRHEDGTVVHPLMPRLIASRGITLRFYLLAIFAAQSQGGSTPATPRLAYERTDRPGWVDLLALDVGYSSSTGTYEEPTLQNRTFISAAKRQITSALRTLSGHGLVEISERKGGSLDYQGFTLMNEQGRGPYHSPYIYTVPSQGIDIPPAFFTNGWINALNPTEIATWLVLRFLKARFPNSHHQRGVFLYGQTREEVFGLKKDAYQDACRLLVDVGLLERILDLELPLEEVTDANGMLLPFATPDLDEYATYEGPHKPHRYRFTDEGLSANSTQAVIGSVQKTLERKRKERVLRNRRKQQ